MHPISEPGAESGADDRADRAGRKSADHAARHESDRLLRRRAALGSPAKAAALMPINPIVHNDLGIYSVHNSSSTSFAIRGDDRRLVGAISALHSGAAPAGLVANDGEAATNCGSVAPRGFRPSARRA